MNKSRTILVVAVLLSVALAGSQTRRTVDIAPVPQQGGGGGGRGFTFEEKRSAIRSTKPVEEQIPSREQRKLLPSNKSKRTAIPSPLKK